MVKVGVTFHELYGYSLTVADIDPAYTLGDMARLRREILARLEADGILNDNKELPLPMLANRIAVISSATAAGYGDFCNQLLRNDYRLRFTVRLFPAVMQANMWNHRCWRHWMRHGPARRVGCRGDYPWWRGDQ